MPFLLISGQLDLSLTTNQVNFFLAIETHVNADKQDGDAAGDTMGFSQRLL